MRTTIYLDNNATTKPLDAVIIAMLPFLSDRYANPSSVHRFGQSARHAVECARQEVARLINAAPSEILFTGTGTESIGLAIVEYSRRLRRSGDSRRRLVTSRVEHHAVLSAMEEMEREGYEVTRLEVNHRGLIDPEAFERALDEDVALVSLTHVNSETGVIEDVATLASLARSRGAAIHVDAVQSAGKLPLDARAWNVDMISLSAHKFHGPKGVGVLYTRRGSLLGPGSDGMNRQTELRGGTENVQGIVGTGVAAEAARAALNEGDPGAARRNRFEFEVLNAWPTAFVVASDAPRVANTSTIIFPGLPAETLLLVLSEAQVCASAGSACASGSVEPSHVLLAMGINPHDALSAVRFSLSRLTTDQEIDQAIERLQEAAPKLLKTVSD